MKNIITIQHTQSVHHTNGMVGSWTDWALSEQEVREANKIGEKLKKELVGQRLVLYASDLLPCQSRLRKAIGKHLNLSPILRTELRERNLGRCCGKSIQWLRENLEMQEKTVDDRLFSDAESRRDVWNRLKPFFDEIMGSEDENILIVSHGDLLSVFNTMFLGLNIEAMNTSEIYGRSGGVSHMLENNDGKRVVKRISDMSYLC